MGRIQLDGGVRRKLPGTGRGGRFASQVSVSWLNHRPGPVVFTAESLTATGYVPIWPAAQLGSHSLSQNMPCPVAADGVQLVQVRSWTPQPLSAHASVIEDGRMLSRCGGALTRAEHWCHV